VERQVEVGGVLDIVDQEAPMDADLDLLLISAYCTADDLLPDRPRNARRRLSDAEVVTLCVAQVLMGIPSDRRFLRAARRQLGHLFPCLPTQDALHKRRARLAEAIEWLLGVFSSHCPGAGDDLLLLDSTPVECGRSLETARRSFSWPISVATATRAATRASSGACACTSHVRPTAPRERPRWWPPIVPSAR
jgi:hypothetical protein